MIRYTNSFFISIVVHSITIVLIVLVWQYYTSSKKIEQEKKVYLKLSNVVTSQNNEQIQLQPQAKDTIQPVQEKKIEKLQSPKKITQVESKPKIIEKEQKEIQKPEIIEKSEKVEEVKKIEKIKEVKKQKEIKKVEKQKTKIAKNYNLEPKKIFDFAIEEVPAELTFLNKKPTTKRVFQEPKEPKIIEKKVVKKVVKPKVVQKSVEKKVTKPKIAQNNVEKKLVKPKAVQKKVVRKPQQTEPSKNYLQVNTKEISKLLRDNLYYPRSAKKRNITGQVLVKFKLGLDSRVYDIKVLESSNEILSRSAMKTIMDLSTKFPKPKKELILHVPIDYKLNI